MGSSAGFIDKFGFKSQTSRREREVNKRMGDRSLLGEVPVCRRWYMIIFLQARNHKKPSVVFGGDCQKRFHNHMFFLNIWVFVSQFFWAFPKLFCHPGEKKKSWEKFRLSKLKHAWWKLCCARKVKRSNFWAVFQFCPQNVTLKWDVYPLANYNLKMYSLLSRGWPKPAAAMLEKTTRSCFRDPRPRPLRSKGWSQHDLKTTKSLGISRGSSWRETGGPNLFRDKS